MTSQILNMEHLRLLKIEYLKNGAWHSHKINSLNDASKPAFSEVVEVTFKEWKEIKKTNY